MTAITDSLLTDLRDLPAVRGWTDGRHELARLRQRLEDFGRATGGARSPLYEHLAGRVDDLADVVETCERKARAAVHRALQRAGMDGDGFDLSLLAEQQ